LSNIFFATLTPPEKRMRHGNLYLS